MTPELPDGYTWSCPALDDVEAIYALVAVHDTRVVGFPDLTLDDVRDELNDPDFNPKSDGWLVADSDGAVVGYGWASRKGISDEIVIDVLITDDDVDGWLWERVLDRCGEIAAELGHAEVNVDIGIFRADDDQRRRAEHLGFTPSTTFHRMRVDHVELPPEPELPSGVEVGIGLDAEQFRRDALSVTSAANVGQFGYVARTFDEWRDATEASSAHDWSQLRVVYLEGEPVAALQANDQFVEDENCGYVQRLAVVEAARGRGLAKLLLRQAFAADARRGRAGTILHVDTNNPTPALDLYLGVGMRAVLVIDVWRRKLDLRPVGGGLR